VDIDWFAWRQRILKLDMTRLSSIQEVSGRQPELIDTFSKKEVKVAPTPPSEVKTAIFGVNWFCQLSNQSLQSDFVNFNHDRKLSRFFLLSVVFATFVLLPTSMANFIEAIKLMSTVGYSSVIASTVELILVNCVVCIGWMINRPHLQQRMLLCTFTCLEFFRCKVLPSRRRQSSRLLSLQRLDISIHNSHATTGRWALSSSSSNRISPNSTPNHKPTALTSELQPSLPEIQSNWAVLRSKLKLLLSTTHSNRERGITLSTDHCRQDQLLSTFFLYTSQLFLIVLFVNRSLSFDCSTQAIKSPLPLQGLTASDSNCPYSNEMLLIHAFVLLICPYLLYTSLPVIGILHCFSVLILAVLVVLYLVVVNHMFGSWILLLFFLCAVLCLVVDFQWQCIQSFAKTMGFKETLVENERAAEAAHVTEMRHMIANVAHDLKTPLASFMGGIECIQLTLNDCRESTFVSEALAGHFDSITSCLSNIRSTQSFMLMTINRCIDYTKASNGLQLVPKHETIDLLETIQLPFNCMTSIQSRVNIRFHPIPPSVCQYIITDKQWLQENLLCLLSNAVKYSVGGQVDISIAEEDFVSRVDVGTSQKGCTAVGSEFVVSPFLRVEVEDRGIGMSDDAMKSLFNPFKQTQRLAGGTGLGLYSLAKRLEALHGHYGVTKRKDGKQGSRFWLAIPYKPDNVYAQHMLKLTSVPRSIAQPTLEPAKPLMPQFLNAFAGLRKSIIRASMSDHQDLEAARAAAVNFALAASPDSDRQAETSISFSMNRRDDPLSILLVDDSPAIVKMTSMMLKRLGHRIATADNGASAVKMVIERWNDVGSTFDVLLMDLQMPVMDGLEATRRIRQWEIDSKSDVVGELTSGRSLKSSPKQVIIGMSANSDHETTLHALEAGVDTFIAKPFNLESIRNTFNSVLRQE
jgi:signal transduction histidine kinase/CheY-like chemotaxis protein